MKTLISLFFAVILTACQGPLTQELTLEVPGKTIKLSTNDWEKMDDPNNFAENYSEKVSSPLHKFNRVATVYLNPMSDDRRSGSRISDMEYVEVFIVSPEFLTVQTRVDKGKYWVMVRETFKPKRNMLGTLASPVLSERNRELLMRDYQEEIDETRFLLGSTF